VADRPGNQAVRKVMAGGEVATWRVRRQKGWMDGRCARPASNGLSAWCRDTAGNLYVADRENNQ
jgi:hypothetical protein